MSSLNDFQENILESCHLNAVRFYAKIRFIKNLKNLFKLGPAFKWNLEAMKLSFHLEPLHITSKFFFEKFENFILILA